MYAIIEADGKQYRVKEGDTIRCDAVDREVGATAIQHAEVIAAVSSWFSVWPGADEQGVEQLVVLVSVRVL